MTTSLTASGKVLVVSLMGALILLVGFGLYLLIRSARRTLRAGGSVRDAPAWFGGPTYRELKPADTAAMVGLRIWRAFGLVLLAVGAGFTIFAVLTSGSKSRTAHGHRQHRKPAHRIHGHRRLPARHHDRHLRQRPGGHHQGPHRPGHSAQRSPRRWSSARRMAPCLPGRGTSNCTSLAAPLSMEPFSAFPVLSLRVDASEAPSPLPSLQVPSRFLLHSQSPQWSEPSSGRLGERRAGRVKSFLGYVLRSQDQWCLTTFEGTPLISGTLL